MGRKTKEPLVILDNTVLTNFSLVGRSDLIYDFWEGKACTTRAVLAEYLAGVNSRDLQADVWIGLPILDLTPSEEAVSLSLSHRLGKGERTCLAIAVTLRAALATDDALARQHARQAGLVIIGTVGILIRAVQKGLLEQAEAQKLLDLMIEVGYRSPIQNLNEI